MNITEFFRIALAVSFLCAVSSFLVSDKQMIKLINSVCIIYLLTNATMVIFDSVFCVSNDIEYIISGSDDVFNCVMNKIEYRSSGVVK